jgi:hypothetical protein
MRRDRSSRCVTSAKDAVDHRSSRLLKKHRLRCNSQCNERNSRVLSRSEVVVRNNVKHVTLSNRDPSDHNQSNSSHGHSNRHADNRSRLNVGRSNHRVNVLLRQHDQPPHRVLSRSRNRNTSARRRRKSSSRSSRRNSSRSKSAAILARAKARNHKTETRITRIRSGFNPA